MSILAFLGACVVLALAGFDPAPLFIAAVYMAARPADSPDAARSVRRTVLAFGVVLIGGTIAWGVGLSLLVGQRLAEFPWEHLLRLGGWAAGVETVLAVAGLVFAVWKWRHRKDPPKEEKNRGGVGLILVALGFVAIVTTDVPFIVAVGLAGEQPLWAVIAGHVVWAVVSQAPLFALCVAVLANKHRALARTVGGWWAAARPVVNVVVPVGVGLVSLVLLADAVEFFAAGRFLIDPRGM